MITWTFKGLSIALALLTLSACEGGQGSALFDAFPVPMAKAKPLSQTKLGGGAFTLVAPPGFCIDGKSVQRQFAVMARCDVLGAPQAAGHAPLAVITVSVLPSGADKGMPSVSEFAAASGLSKVSDRRIADDQITFRAVGMAPVAGLSKTHWRGARRISDQLVGVALFGPEDGAALSGEGRRIISAVMSGSRGGL